jgi:hypothetical protein
VRSQQLEHDLAEEIWQGEWIAKQDKKLQAKQEEQQQKSHKAEPAATDALLVDEADAETAETAQPTSLASASSSSSSAAAAASSPSSFRFVALGLALMGASAIALAAWLSPRVRRALLGGGQHPDEPVRGSTDRFDPAVEEGF